MNIYSLLNTRRRYEMPNRDGTGPEGKGPKTGRQMGNCKGAQPVGRGLGPYGRGTRRGFGRRDIDQDKKKED